ncbi:hypothetical protein JCM10450v2_007333 [Rhodotorula kratochvilovae]
MPLGTPPLSRSMPNLALEADPPTDNDDDDEEELPTTPPPRVPPSPPPEPSSPGYAEELSPELYRHARLHGSEGDVLGGGAAGWGAPQAEEAAHDEDEGEEGLTARDFATTTRERRISLASIHSAPELALPASPPAPAAGHERESTEEEGEGAGSPLLSASEELEPEKEGRKRRRRAGKRLATLWDYLQEEIFTVEMDGEEGIKSERVTNFLAVPQELEKIIIFGVFICLDSFLYTFTILPLRALAALVRLLSNQAHNLLLLLRLRPGGTRKRHLRLSHKCDLTKAAILAGTLFLLHKVTDASKMYHGVRGQETIKLYVLFNVLEIADRLCCSFGQDLQDSLFSRQTFGRRTDGSHPHLRPAALFGLTLGYVVAHSVVLFYQLITLNVAVNSYSNALLTLLLSNQFVEIKGSVFKKFEKENLFQLTCADIVERFQLGLMLFIISLRNLIARSSSFPSLSLLSYLPSSSSLSPGALLPLLHQTFSPAVVVLCSECAVDWLKHAFITKFNHIRPGVYGRFVDVLCKDLVAGASPQRRESEPFVDQSPLVSRRLGFAALPLGCLVVRVISQAFEMLADESALDDLVALKLLIGISLRTFSTHRLLSSAPRLAEESLASRSRPKIGVTASEAALDAEVSALLRAPVDGEREGGQEGGRRKGLEELGRYDMVKSRLW